MPRLGILNILLGFSSIFLASAAGPIIASDMTKTYFQDPNLWQNWQSTLLSSSHGHTNLMGIIQILLGLTLPYSRIPTSLKVWQTAGSSLGTLAMGPMLTIRALQGPVQHLDWLEVTFGICASAYLASLGIHLYGLTAKLIRPL